jgi:hypothetical protein
LYMDLSEGAKLVQEEIVTEGLAGPFISFALDDCSDCL